jgi:two-component system chemotaxis response regulator CheB
MVGTHGEAVDRWPAHRSDLIRDIEHGCDGGTNGSHRSRPPLVVIGGSSGAIAALRILANQLPVRFPAPVLVALHCPPMTWSAHQLIGGRLPVQVAADGAPVRPGYITLAPPDWHLVVEDGRLHLSDTHEEHHFRPAIDPLFRTAARAYGPAVIGILLSGRNADGTAGLLNVVLHGGVAIVQDPAEADSPVMPLSALDNVPGAVCLPLADIATALVNLLCGTDPSAAHRRNGLRRDGATRSRDRQAATPDTGDGHWR